jgi:hypothetical protein
MAKEFAFFKYVDALKLENNLGGRVYSSTWNVKTSTAYIKTTTWNVKTST